MIKGILFDKDGTLLEFHATQHFIFEHIFASLKDRYRVPDPLLHGLRGALGHLPDRLKSDSLIQHGTNLQIAQTLLDCSIKYAAEQRWRLPFGINDLLVLIDELSIRDDVPYTALPDVPETLRYLKHKHYKLGIATIDSLTGTVAGLKRTGIFDYFEYLGTGENSLPKPDPFLAEKFCLQCDLKASEILIVGDSQMDMLFAKNAGAHFIGIEKAGERFSIFKENGARSVSNIIEMIDVYHL